MSEDNGRVPANQVRMRGLVNGGVLTLVFVVLFFLLRLWFKSSLIGFLGDGIGGLMGRGLEFILSLSAIVCLFGGLVQFVIGKPIMFKKDLKDTIVDGL